MSAIATVLARHGPRRHRQRPEGVGGDRAPGRRTGSRWPSATAPANLGAADVVTVVLGRRPTNPEVVEAGRRGIGVLSRAEVLAAIAALRRCVAVAGTHGKTTTASMLALMLVEAGLRPSFLIGGDVNEIGTNAVWDEGGVAGGRGRRERRHLPRAGARDRRGDQRRGRPPRPLRVLRRAAVGLRAPSWPARRRGGVVGADDPVAAGIGRAAGAEIGGDRPTGCRPAGWSTSSWPGARSPSGCRTRREPAGPTGRARPGAPQRPQRRRGRGGRPGGRGPLRDAVARALARFAGVARRFEFRGEARRGAPSWTTTPTCPARCGPRWPRPATGAGPGGGGVPAPPLQPHRRALGPSSATPSPMPTWWWSPTSTAPARPRCPGCPGRLVADAVRGADPGLPVLYVPGRAELRAWSAGLLRPGDLCLTLGAGDLTTLPDELLADADGERRGEHPPPATSAALAGPSGPGRGRTIPSVRSPPTGSGAGRAVRRGVDEDAADGGGPAHLPVDLPVLVLGRGSNLLVADAGVRRPGARPGRRLRHARPRRAAGSGPAAAVEPPGAGPAHRGGRARGGWSGRWGCRDRSGGPSG